MCGTKERELKKCTYKAFRCTAPITLYCMKWIKKNTHTKKSTTDEEVWCSSQRKTSKCKCISVPQQQKPFNEIYLAFFVLLKRIADVGKNNPCFWYFGLCRTKRIRRFSLVHCVTRIHRRFFLSSMFCIHILLKWVKRWYATTAITLSHSDARKPQSIHCGLVFLYDITVSLFFYMCMRCSRVRFELYNIVQ